jgi:nucleoside 2-deoxyribosyltransferase
VLEDAGIHGLDPMRGKDYLAKEQSIGNDYDSPLSCSRGIMTRDHWDCTRCDILLVNFLGSARVSIGTCMEIAWAYDNQIPIICVIEESGNPHDHAMIREAIGFRVATLDQGLMLARAILCQ